MTLRWALLGAVCILASAGSARGELGEGRGAPRAEVEVPPVPPLTSVLLGFDVVEGELGVEAVRESVLRHHPRILASVAYVEEAQGKALATRSAFDTEVSAKGEAYPIGYYERGTADVSLSQLTPLRGLTLYGGYRVGQGDFPVYYGGQETGDGGEWRAGAALPLLKGGAIDPERAALQRGALGVEGAGFAFTQMRISLLLEASAAYWGWVAAAQILRVESQLLQIAEDRDAQVRARVAAGDLPPIEVWENRRLILKRQEGVVAAERYFQGAALKLSLYLRSEEGAPIRAPVSAVPRAVSLGALPSPEALEDHLRRAAAARPEIGKYRREIAQARVDLALARNGLAPQLDLRVEGSQDVGVTPKALAPTEVKVGLTLKVDAQRRKAKGEAAQANAQVTQLEQALTYLEQKIAVEVQDALAEVMGAARRVDLAGQEVQASGVLEEGERARLALGDSTLLIVNLREQATADARRRLIKAQVDLQIARAAFSAVLGEDP